MRRTSKLALIMAILASPVCALAVQGPTLDASESDKRAGASRAAGDSRTAPLAEQPDAVVSSPESTVAPPLVRRASRAATAEVAPRVIAVQSTTRRPVGQAGAPGAPPLDALALTRELQRELRRVACYGGPVTGVWTPSTRQAMQRFNERANAGLPVSKPDEALLAMVRSHAGPACGDTCRAGETLTAGGRCLPAAIAERNGKTGPGVPPKRTLSSAPDAPVVELRARPAGELTAGVVEPGRMGLAGPKAAVVAPPPHTQRPRAEVRGHGRQKRVSTAKRENAARRMGAWIFSDAPVDRVLAR